MALTVVFLKIVWVISTTLASGVLLGNRKKQSHADETLDAGTVAGMKVGTATCLLGISGAVVAQGG